MSTANPAALTVTRLGHACQLIEIDEIPDRFGKVNLAILPTNGLGIRPIDMRQVVMDALARRPDDHRGRSGPTAFRGRRRAAGARGRGPAGTARYAGGAPVT